MNNDRTIEKLLRRYAKKRRDEAGPPVEMHPATRRLLQGEVARQYRKDAADGRWSSFVQSFKAWLPQLAWAVPLFVIVAIGLWSLLDRPATQQLALGPAPNQTTAAAPESQVSSPKPKAAGVSVADVRLQTADSGLSPASVPVRVLNQPTPSLADNSLAGENRRVGQELAYVTATNQSVTSLAGPAERKGGLANYDAKGEVQTGKLGLASSAAPARARFAETASANRVNIEPTDPTVENDATLQINPGKEGLSVAKAMESAPLARSDSLEREQAQTYSQSFANLAPEALKQKVAKDFAPAQISQVLVNFQVEQTGRQLRVVDGDGSLYLGETDASPVIGADSGGSKKEPAVQLFKTDGKLNQLPTVATSVPQQQAQNNLYRVAGTNRTLNQAVVFTWSYVEMTNQPVLAQSGKISGDLNKDAQKLPTQFPARLQNSFINGRAQFETGQEIEINAVPVAR